MKKIRDFHPTSRFILILLTVVCLFSIGFSYFSSGYGVSLRTAVGTVIVPLQTGINRIGSFFADLTDERVTLSEVSAENEALRAENEALKDQIDRYSSNLARLYRLEDLLEISDFYEEYEMTGANIIATESVNWNYRFTIDKGSADGITPDMTVINSDGLVGIVTEVSKQSSIVQTIADDASNVSGMLADTLDNCIVTGNQETIRSGTIDIGYVSADSSIEEGSVIVTSNVSSKYVEGIPIGIVTELEEDSNQLTKSGTIVPFVDFSHLKEVLVITQTKADIPEEEES